MYMTPIKAFYEILRNAVLNFCLVALCPLIINWSQYMRVNVTWRTQRRECANNINTHLFTCILRTEL